MSEKCCDDCPGDDTCEHAKLCMCGSYMDGHGYDSHTPCSMHDWYSRPAESPEKEERKMSDPKGSFEAAVRAGCHIAMPSECEYPRCACAHPARLKAAFAAALPPAPAPETLLIIAKANSRQKWANLNAGEEEREKAYALDIYRALRATLLPGEEPS